MSETPFYQEIGEEVNIFKHAHQNQLPLMLKGPTGCGKSRFVEYMASQLNRSLVTVACHEDTGAVDLLGRYLIQGGETVWQDGPLTRAMREGAILYLDEVAEARPDVLVVIHPLTDHRRSIFLDRHNELLTAPKDFMLVVSYNPGYQSNLKEMKPSTKQRFVAMSFKYPKSELEESIVAKETLVESKMAQRLVSLANQLRAATELGLVELPSTRLLIDAAILIRSGLSPRIACDVAIAQPLSDDPEINQTINDMASLLF